MANIIGRKSYLTLVSEATWGTFNGSPTYLHLPCNQFGVRLRDETRQATPYTGVLQKKHNTVVRGQVGGQIVCDLYGWIPTGSNSLQKILLDWAFGNLETTEGAAYSAQWAEGPNTSNRQYTGLRMDSATLSGSEQSQAWSLTMNVKGKDEATLATAQSIPNSRNKLAEALFTDSTFAIAGSAITLKSFQMETSRNLQVFFNNSNRPSIIVAVGPVETKVTMVPQKTDDTYDVMRRVVGMSEFTGQAVIKGNHNGTGGVGTTYSVCTIDFARLSFVDMEEQDVDSLMFQGLTLQALKPDTSAASVVLTHTEV